MRSARPTSPAGYARSWQRLTACAENAISVSTATVIIGRNPVRPDDWPRPPRSRSRSDTRGRRDVEAPVRTRAARDDVRRRAAKCSSALAARPRPHPAPSLVGSYRPTASRRSPRRGRRRLQSLEKLDRRVGFPEEPPDRVQVVAGPLRPFLGKLGALAEQWC